MIAKEMPTEMDQCVIHQECSRITHCLMVTDLFSKPEFGSVHLHHLNQKEQKPAIAISW